jgi:hypothetical protein
MQSRGTVVKRSCELKLANLLFKAEPTPLTATMITLAIPEAIRQYSMAVAPDSFLAKRASRCMEAFLL